MTNLVLAATAAALVAGFRSFPVALAVVIMLVMWTWRQGSKDLFEKSRRQEVPLLDLIRNLEGHPPPRISGTVRTMRGPCG